MKIIFRVIIRIILCLFQWVFMPFAHVADDRIFAARHYGQALWMSERLRQEKQYWSIITILRRAARRQEFMNQRGQQKYDELQARKWDTAFAIEFHARILLCFFTLWYGTTALTAIAHDHYPWLYVAMVEADKMGCELIDSFWKLFPGPPV